MIVTLAVAMLCGGALAEESSILDSATVYMSEELAIRNPPKTLINGLFSEEYIFSPHPATIFEDKSQFWQIDLLQSYEVVAAFIAFPFDPDMIGNS